MALTQGPTGTSTQAALCLNCMLLFAAVAAPAGAALVGAASVIYRDPSKEDGPPSPLSPSSPPSPALLTSSLSDLGSSVSAYEAAWAASGAGAGSPMRALLMAVGAPAPSAAGAPLFGNAMVVLAQMFNALQVGAGGAGGRMRVWCVVCRLVCSMTQ